MEETLDNNTYDTKFPNRNKKYSNLLDEKNTTADVDSHADNSADSSIHTCNDNSSNCNSHNTLLHITKFL